jgi:uncharacterized protein DUF5060/collagenase-like protein with putative collagen-binding domain
MRAALVGAAVFVIAGVSVGGARQAGGSAAAVVSGELRQWHKVTLTFNGPQATETDTSPNPFTDYRMTVVFTHESGAPRYEVPGYFAADGDAANTSATSGNKWRAHVSPDKVGRWNWRASLVSGPGVAVTPGATGQAAAPVDGATGSFEVAASNKAAPDFRAKGRLQYVGRHYLRFAGSGEYFLKAGPDSPETLLAYEDFDGTRTLKTAIHAYAPHVQDWKDGDPTWAKTKGKALIGAINYLSSKGMNAMSLMPYNGGGDGDNVWPFVDRDDKFHYDVSKLDQWQIVFDHAQAKGIYLHFKLQEQENDDGTFGGGGGGGGRGGRGGAAAVPGRGGAPGAGAPAAQPAAPAATPPAAAPPAAAAPEGRGAGGRGAAPAAPCPVPASLDCGNTGPERRLYMRELIARFGYELALNWNMGEENTQTTAQQRAMAQYIHDVDPYDHIVVVHTFPNQQEDVYQPHLGQTLLQGLSLQNSWNAAHQQTARWVRGSAAAGVPWVVANDEQGSASTGVPPDPGYPGFTGKDNQGNMVQSLHDIRKLTLWGNLMAGGAGVEYYFGYVLPDNDLTLENFRSRDKSWDYARIALTFFRTEKIPFWDMTNADGLVGNHTNDNSVFCFAKPGDLYLVYLPSGGSADLDLTGATGQFNVSWFDPRNGGALKRGSVASVAGGKKVSLGAAPASPEEDWLVVVRR